ncbi:NAD(P)-binding protein [Massarina eburnea CBS 473.64]|uniref:NAD(P)-binding protein n=1 Tax=Massarina eburnea CBS 473.64 TaxID=1395130 RepID=A0A6A6RVH7_9PLEO|nr:NAD(P)-binding protein [Massarina eburnea CBS 473.64]
MASSPSVFLLGPGYTGLTIIDALLVANHPVTTVLRNKDIAATLSARGVTTLHGTLDDHAIITAQAAAHPITINTSSSDDLPSVQAIIAGLRQRVASSLPTTFIHTSGTGLLCDDAKGKFKSEKIYSDEGPEMIDELPDTALHRKIDLAIVAAGKEFGDKARLCVVLPPVIYGLNPEHKRQSIMFPRAVHFALKHGYACYVNEGKNVWGGVHVLDLARAYMILLTHLSSHFTNPPSLDTVSNPYFFVENGTEFLMKEVAEHVARVLHKLGKIDTNETKPIPEHLYHDFLGPVTEIAGGGNSRSNAVRLRELGWVPREKGIWRSWEEDEVDWIVESFEK